MPAACTSGPGVRAWPGVVRPLLLAAMVATAWHRAASPALADTVRVFAAGAAQGMVQRLQPGFGAASGHKLDVVAGIRAVQAYGHSPGLMAYHVESAGRRLLIWADVTNHYVMSLQQPEWHVSYDDIKDMAVATRKRILDMVATDQIPAIGYHMPFPSVGFVEKAGAGYRWMPASYQLNL